MDLEILLAVEVLECSFGMFGFLIGDLQDCYWRKYYLEDPIAGIHWLSALDTQTTLLDWWCNYQLKDEYGNEIYLGQPLGNGDKGYANQFFAPKDDDVVIVLPPVREDDGKPAVIDKGGDSKPDDT